MKPCYELGKAFENFMYYHECIPLGYFICVFRRQKVTLSSWAQTLFTHVMNLDSAKWGIDKIAKKVSARWERRFVRLAWHEMVGRRQCFRFKLGVIFQKGIKFQKGSSSYTICLRCVAGFGLNCFAWDWTDWPLRWTGRARWTLEADLRSWSPVGILA